MFKAINSEDIKTWEEFEFVLGFIIENRLLQLYQTYLNSEYQRKWKKIDQDLFSFQEVKPLKKPL